MTTYDELLDRAKHYRKVALLVTDEEIAAGLRELADRYEAVARAHQERANLACRRPLA